MQQQSAPLLLPNGQFAELDGFEPAYSEWLLRLTAEESADNTLVAYAADVSFVVGALAEALGRPLTTVDLSAIKQEDVDGAIEIMASSGNGNATIRRRFAAFRSFCKHVGQSGYADVSGILNSKLPRPQTNERPAIPDPDATLLIHPDIVTEGREHDWTVDRDIAILHLHRDCGLTVGEIVGLDGRDMIVGQSPLVRIRSTHLKERTVDLSDAAAAALHCYKQEAPFKLLPELPLFYGLKGERLLPRLVQFAVVRARELLGLPDSCTPQAIRHTFGEHLARQGAPIQDVASKLGLRKANAAARYFRDVPLDMSDAMDAVQKLSRDRLQGKRPRER